MKDFTIIILIVLLIYLLAGKKKTKYQRRPQYQRKSLRHDVVYIKNGRVTPAKEKSAEEKGAEGEWFVARSELERLPGDLFFVFNDINVEYFNASLIG